MKLIILSTLLIPGAISAAISDSGLEVRAAPACLYEMTMQNGWVWRLYEMEASCGAYRDKLCSSQNADVLFRPNHAIIGKIREKGLQTNHVLVSLTFVP
ncbi:hypothetical protein WAI453_001621 [Rhynchosporium graminicola]